MRFGGVVGAAHVWGEAVVLADGADAPLPHTARCSSEVVVVGVWVGEGEELVVVVRSQQQPQPPGAAFPRLLVLG